MAATCTLAGLTTAANCFGAGNFSAHEQKAVLVYQLAAILTAIGGTQYIDATPSEAYGSNENTLFISSANIKDWSDDKKTAAIIGVLNSGLAANDGFFATVGAVATLTRAEMATAITCFKNRSTAELDGAIVFLICSIWSAQQTP